MNHVAGAKRIESVATSDKSEWGEGGAEEEGGKREGEVKNKRIEKGGRKKNK